MSEKKFDPKKLKKLNDPQRLADIPPRFIMETLGLKIAPVMVDIGAGTGFFSIALLEQSPESKVYACDISDVMLDWLKENISNQYPAIIPVKMEESSVPLDDGIADLVFMINLHHELEEPNKLLKETARLLKRGGKVAIIDWKKEEMAEGPPERIRCEVSEVEETLARSGFTSVRVNMELEKHFIVTGEKS